MLSPCRTLLIAVWSICLCCCECVRVFGTCFHTQTNVLHPKDRMSAPKWRVRAETDYAVLVYLHVPHQCADIRIHLGRPKGVVTTVSKSDACSSGWADATVSLRQPQLIMGSLKRRHSVQPHCFRKHCLDREATCAIPDLLLTILGMGETRAGSRSPRLRTLPAFL